MASRLATPAQPTDVTPLASGTPIAPLPVIMAELDSLEACTNAYSDIEEDFFRAGEAMSTGISPEPAADPEPVRSKGLLARLFERPLRLPTEDLIEIAPPPVPVRTRPPTERPAADESGEDEWDWMLAVARARARHATAPGI